MTSQKAFAMKPAPATQRMWVLEAIALLEKNEHQAAFTPLLKLSLPSVEGVDIYLKNESAHASGSLKHRLARSLLLFGLCNGNIIENTPLIEASSGSTAVSLAYFARILALPFTAVMARTTSRAKIAAIEAQGGQCFLVDQTSQIYETANRLACEQNGYYLDQFTNAERATNWRTSNVVEEILQQLQTQRYPVPTYLVMSAGTGGTATTMGRYVRYHGLTTQLCVADPEHSVFYDSYISGNRHLTSVHGSRIEGIGRPRVEPSFTAGVIDQMIKVEDTASIGAMLALSQLLGFSVGASTGTNFYATWKVAMQMKNNSQRGSVVTLICDGGDRYSDTYHNPVWVKRHFPEAPACKQLFLS